MADVDPDGILAVQVTGEGTGLPGRGQAQRGAAAPGNGPGGLPGCCGAVASGDTGPVPGTSSGGPGSTPGAMPGSAQAAEPAKGARLGVFRQDHARPAVRAFSANSWPKAVGPGPGQPWGAGQRFQPGDVERIGDVVSRVVDPAVRRRSWLGVAYPCCGPGPVGAGHGPCSRGGCQARASVRRDSGPRLRPRREPGPPGARAAVAGP
jgi:hypothetical protein